VTVLLISRVTFSENEYFMKMYYF